MARLRETSRDELLIRRVCTTGESSCDGRGVPNLRVGRASSGAAQQNPPVVAERNREISAMGQITI